MDYLHSIGVLHGDLKGANVLLKSTATDPRGFTCKLADFGMSRVLETNKTHVSTHTYGTVQIPTFFWLGNFGASQGLGVHLIGMADKASHLQQVAPVVSWVLVPSGQHQQQQPEGSKRGAEVL